MENKKLPLVMFIPSVGKVELSQANFDVDFLANIARTCKYGDNPPPKTEEQNDNLIRSLLVSKHLSVFEFVGATFKITAPIFCARQLMRYRTGSYCEKSLRATTVERRAEDGTAYTAHYNACVDYYNALIAEGEKKEEARRVLPLDTPTTYYFKIDGRNLLHLLEERTSKATQWETRAIAEAMRELVKLNNRRFAEVVGLC